MKASTYYIIEKGTIAVELNGSLVMIQPEWTVWGTFIQGETNRILMVRTNKKEAAKLAKDCGMKVADKVYTEDEAWQIREGQLKNL